MPAWLQFDKSYKLLTQEYFANSVPLLCARPGYLRYTGGMLNYTHIERVLFAGSA